VFRFPDCVGEAEQVAKVVWLTVFCVVQKKECAKTRVEDQKAIDKPILASIKKEPMLASYLASSFSLRKSDKPHEMKW